MIKLYRFNVDEAKKTIDFSVASIAKKIESISQNKLSSRLIDPSIYKKFNKIIEDSYGMSFKSYSKLKDNNSDQQILALPASRKQDERLNNDNSSKCSLTAITIIEKIKLAKNQLKILKERK